MRKGQIITGGICHMSKTPSRLAKIRSALLAGCTGVALGGAAAIAAFWGVWHLIAGGIIVGLFRAYDRVRG